MGPTAEETEESERLFEGDDEDGGGREEGDEDGGSEAAEAAAEEASAAAPSASHTEKATEHNAAASGLDAEAIAAGVALLGAHDGALPASSLSLLPTTAPSTRRPSADAGAGRGLSGYSAEGSCLDSSVGSSNLPSPPVASHKVDAWAPMTTPEKDEALLMAVASLLVLGTSAVGEATATDVRLHNRYLHSRSSMGASL